MPEARLAMPFDPNFARNPLPPLNDGYPDDWHVPPSAQGDGFPDDWYVPESAAVPSASQPAPSAHPNAANPGFAGWPAPPPGSIAAYWARMAADRQRTAPWAPPMFPDAFGRFPPSPFAPAPPNLAPNAPGLFGSPPKIPDWQPSSPAGGLLANMAANSAAPLQDFPPGILFGGVKPMPAGTETSWPDVPRGVLFAGTGNLPSGLFSNPGNSSIPRASPLDIPRGVLFGGQAGPEQANADAPAAYPPASQSFTAPDPIRYPGGNHLSAYLRNNLSYSSSQPPAPDQLRSNDPSDVVSNIGADDGDQSVILVGGTEEEEEERKREQQKRDRDRALFNERAFGTTPPLGNTAPKILPPLGGDRAPPVTASPQAAPAQAPSSPRAGDPVQPTLPGSPPPNGARAGDSQGPAKAGAGGGVSSPAPSVAVGGAVTPPDSNWRRLVQNIERIKDAWAQGGGKLPAAISAALPKYDGKTTYGILITNEGDVIPLQSADADPLFNNYIPAGHVEGKAALWIRDHGSSGGVVYHNNTDGTCGFCNSQLETLLQKKSNLLVIAPADAVAKKQGAVQDASFYEGNDALPRLPRQFNLFRRRP